jgi:predicted Fe-Mo cluster-binding NifX family protein
MKVAIPTERNLKKNDRVAKTFSRAKTFTFISIKDGRPFEYSVIENNASKFKQGAGPLAARTLKDNGITTLISGDIGPGATTILEALGIEIYHTNSGKLVKKVIEDWLTQND